MIHTLALLASLCGVILLLGLCKAAAMADEAMEKWRTNL